MYHVITVLGDNTKSSKHARVNKYYIIKYLSLQQFVAFELKQVHTRTRLTFDGCTMTLVANCAAFLDCRFAPCSSAVSPGEQEMVRLNPSSKTTRSKHPAGQLYAWRPFSCRTLQNSLLHASFELAFRCNRCCPY